MQRDYGWIDGAARHALWRNRIPVTQTPRTLAAHTWEKFTVRYPGAGVVFAERDVPQLEILVMLPDGTKLVEEHYTHGALLRWTSQTATSRTP